MEKKVSVNVKDYFEGNIYYLGWMMLIASILAVFAIWFVGLILAFLGVMIVSSRFKLVIDVDKKTIDDYLSIFGLKTKHEQLKYQKLKYIIINSSKFTQQLNYKSISSNVGGMIYSAFLVGDQDKYFLGDSQDLEKLKSKVQAFAHKLGIEVKDHSRSQT